MTTASVPNEDQGKKARFLLRTVIASCVFCGARDNGHHITMPEDHEMAPGEWACIPCSRKNGGPS